MTRDGLNDLTAFLAVAREASFTKAAAKLGVTPSALSHTVRGLEGRLGLRLLTRTTRSVALTEAGERLVGTAGPHLDGIEQALVALTALRDRPAGTVRISSGEHAAETLLWPALRRVLPDYPEVHVELVADNGLTDIVSERYDAGVRLGEQVARDMVAVRIGPDLSMAVVATPAYLAAHGAPGTPQDLTAHRCLNIRMPTAGGLFPWEFERDGRELRVRVEGQWIFNNARLAVQAALDGLGLAWVTCDRVRDHLDTGRLQRVMTDWCPPFSGYHLYYPSRRQHSPAFALVLATLRYQGTASSP